MMVFLLTTSCMILAAGVCSISYVVVNRRLQRSSTHSSERDNVDISNSTFSSAIMADENAGKKNKLLSLWEEIKKGFSVSPLSRWIIFSISVALVGIVAACALLLTWGGTGLDSIGVIKVVVTALLLMSAAVIDLYTKKIPNYISIAFLLLGTGVLIAEFFLMRESFLLLLTSSLIGLVGGFLVLLVMSLLTKGGLGMGDVKLLSTMGFLSGIAASFYSFFSATVLCLFVTLFLLVSKTKKLKDQLPFGPFIFWGYVIVIILGKF